MPFPSEGYIQFCIEHQEVFRELWEPRPGDWFYNPSQDKVHLLTRNNTWFIGAPKRFIEHNIPLPRQDQLVEMLEERGLRVVLHVLPNHESKARAYWPRYVGEGSTPAIALGKALIEVMSLG